MIYRSNLTCPDLTPHFKHLHVRPMPHSFGHSVPSDWADKADDYPVFGLYKKCGLWTHDEAAILFQAARHMRGKTVVDIGAHTGWTGKHVNWATNAEVICVDPMLRVPEFRQRFIDNTGFPQEWLIGETSNEFFGLNREVRHRSLDWRGFVIDGDHEPGKPLEDAQCAAAQGFPEWIIFHDFWGQPVWSAVVWLMDQGYKAKVYCTPHGVAVCWRGDFVPPEHVPDPNLVRLKLETRMIEFPWNRADWWGR